MVRTRKAATPSPKKKARGKVVSDAEKRAKFKELIEPRLHNIRTLTVRYTDQYQDVDDNYTYVLSQMYSYIHTYDRSKSIDTWVHIVTKRACFNQNQRRARYSSLSSDLELYSNDAIYQHGNANIVNASCGTLGDNVSDVIYAALRQIDPFKLSPFLLFAQGLSIRDITTMEWQSGHLERKCEDIVKSRIYWAQQQLRFILKEYGISEASYTSAFSNK